MHLGSPKILLVDEIAMRKGHTYLTLIADWEQGKILWVGEGRKYVTIKEFFDSLSEEQKGSLWAIAEEGMISGTVKSSSSSKKTAGIPINIFPSWCLIIIGKSTWILRK